MNTCLSGGLVVNPFYPVPEDLCLHHSDPATPVGCNRIFCSHCGAWVRNLPGHRMVDSGHHPPAVVAQIYDSSDPQRSPLLTDTLDAPGIRVYFCRCQICQVGGVRPIDICDVSDWTCAGHPEASPSGDLSTPLPER